MYEKQRDLLFKLTICRGIGNLGILKLLDFSIHHGTSEFTKEEIIRVAQITTHANLFTTSWDYWSNHPEKLSIYQQEHQFITVLDQEYPSLLKQIYNCPAILFYQGNITYLNTPSLAIVGARQSTSYGKEVLAMLIPYLVNNGLTIVSGLAKGIDSLGHKFTIQSQGKTIAVIGTGLDLFYPKETKEIQKKMLKTQLVISEYPNGTGPQRYHFPTRNRIIAGISLGTCVIEARKKSGSLITAQAALEYNREVFAVPGGLNQPLSEGCNKLIQEGAKCLVSANDIIEELQFF